MTTLWDTNGSAVVKELAAQRRTGGAVLSGVALTLVVVADESRVTEAEEAATARRRGAPVPGARRRPPADRGPGPAAGRRGAHRRPAGPRRGRRHADVRPARAARGVGRAAAAGRRRPGGRLVARRAAGPDGHRRRSAVFADRRITDSSMAEDPLAALRTRAEDYAPGDTDLAWTRSTAVAGDPRLHPGLGVRPPRRAGARAGRPVEGDPDNATAQLLAGWLSSRCGCTDRRGGEHPHARAQRRRLRRRCSWTRTRRSGSQADRTGGAVIDQPFRPDATVALPDRALGDLLSEELRRLDPDEPYSEALEAATGVSGPRPSARRAASTSGSTRAEADEPERRERQPAEPADAKAGDTTGGAADRRRSDEQPAAAPRQHGSRQSPSPGDRSRRLPRRRPTPDVVIEPDADRLARAVASALVARLAAAQAVHGTASVVLTGGGIGTAVLEQVAGLAAEPVRETVDWSAVDVWWGDERFVPADNDERNEKRRPARRCSAGSGVDPETDPRRCRRPTASFAEPEDAADWYAEQLRRRAPEGRPVPRHRRAAAGHGPRGARRLDLPGLPGRRRRAAGGRGPRLPEAAADPDQPGLPGDQRRRGGVAAGLRARARPPPSPGRWPAPRRPSCPPPGCTAGGPPAGCSTRPRPSELRHRLA